MLLEPLPSPWREFLEEVDDLLTEPVSLHCLGGFVINMCYGLQRPTGDIDFLQVIGQTPLRPISGLTAEGGELHRKYKVYLDPVTVAQVPEEYESRLIEMFPGRFKHLQLMALDPYDLALAKLARNAEHDRSDVAFLARTIPFDLELLERRYRDELRPIFVGDARVADLTMELWIEMILEERGTTA